MALRLTLALALAVIVFTLWPALDLRGAELVWAAAGGRFVESEALERLRHLIWDASIVLALGALALWPAWALLGARARVPARLWGFVALLYTIGPGLLVNGLFKEHWGRARPADIARFGGDARFTPPFQIADQCQSNCSFVSGEGAAAIAFALAVGILAWPHATGAARRWLVGGLGTVAFLGSFLRVITGRHFVSDVVFGALVVAFVALGLFHLMRLRPARPALTRANLRHDLSLLAALVRCRLRR